MKPDLAAITLAAPDVPERLVAEHLARLDDSYFERFDQQTVIGHLRGLAELSPLLTVNVVVAPNRDGLVECTILGFDAPGLFSLATGILMSLGFSILSGDVYTYGSAVGPANPRRIDPYRRRRIVDVFVGRRTDAELDLADWQAELRQRLLSTVGAVERQGLDGLQVARQRVNEWVTQRLERIGPARPRSPFATDVKLEQAGESGLRLSVESEDTPAFLYSLSAALALHDIAIKRVRIDTSGGRVHDQLEVDVPRTGADGGLQESIRVAVLLTKQFTYFLDRAPDPYAALTRFDWLATRVASDTEHHDWLALLANPEAMPYLARLLGASDFLWEDFIRQRYDQVLAMLRSRLQSGSSIGEPLASILEGKSAADQRAEITAYRDREAFRIQLDGVLDEPADPRMLSRQLTGLAEQVVSGSVRLICAELEKRMGPPGAPFAVFALGKFGAAALGYASDLELLLVYDGPAGNTFFRDLLEQLQTLFRGKQEGLFELDLRLRPWGKNAALECPLSTFESYYAPGGDAHSLERLALTRLRAVAGDPAFGSRVEGLRDRLIYEESWLKLEELAETRDMQFRQKHAGARNAKYSRGALVDIEYGVQVLQVQCGGALPALRTPELDTAIARFGSSGIVQPEEASQLAQAYIFLRRLINALRMLRGIAEDLELPDVDSLEARHLARRMGYHEGDWLGAAEAVDREFALHTSFVREFVSHYVSPEMLPGVQSSSISAGRN